MRKKQPFRPQNLFFVFSPVPALQSYMLYVTKREGTASDPKNGTEKHISRKEGNPEELKHKLGKEFKKKLKRSMSDDEDCQ